MKVSQIRQENSNRKKTLIVIIHFENKFKGECWDLDLTRIKMFIVVILTMKISITSLISPFQLSPDQRKNLAVEYGETGAKRAVETRLLSFLTYNYYHLPMYAKPGMV